MFTMNRLTQTHTNIEKITKDTTDAQKMTHNPHDDTEAHKTRERPQDDREALFSVYRGLL